MGHKSETCSYKNNAARNARAIEGPQEGPIFLIAAIQRNSYDYPQSMQGESNDQKQSV